MQRFWSFLIQFSSQSDFRTIACSLVLLLVWWSSTGLSAGQVAGNSPPGPDDTVARPSEAGSSPRTKHPRRYELTRIGDRAIGDTINFYSLEQERAIGTEMARDIDARLHLLTDPTVNEYVNRIVQNIVRHSNARIPVTVKIVIEDEVDTNSFPGGFIYVNSGLILAADDEATLAAMLAHEVAHVAARHGTEILTRQRLLRLASRPLTNPGGGVYDEASLVKPMALMKFIRHLEREADLLAIEYSYAAGYDPEAFVRFFEKLRASHGPGSAPVAGSLATHPTMEERIERAQIEIATMLPPTSEYVVTTSEFEQVKARLLALTHRSCRHESGKPGPRSAMPCLTKASSQ